jgi:hypothetical protein
VRLELPVGGRSRVASSAESKIPAPETATSAMTQFSNAEQCLLHSRAECPARPDHGHYRRAVFRPAVWVVRAAVVGRNAHGAA